MTTIEARQKELNSELGSLALKMKALETEIAASKKTEINLPVDTLMVVNGRETNPRYYAGNGRYFCDGKNSHTSNDIVTYEVANYRLLTGNKVFWEGGDCPLPDGVKVKVWYRLDGVNSIGDPATVTLPSYRAETWTHDGSEHDIIAYQVQESSEWIKPSMPNQGAKDE